MGLAFSLAGVWNSDCVAPGAGKKFFSHANFDPIFAGARSSDNMASPEAMLSPDDGPQNMASPCPSKNAPDKASHDLPSREHAGGIRCVEAPQTG